MTDELWRVWCVSQWLVADIEQMDDWGHKPGHPEYRLDIRHDYTTHVPPEFKHRAVMMKMAQSWNMTPNEVQNMGLSEFHENAMLHKAITLRKPKWEGWRGAVEYRRWIIESKGKWLSAEGPWLTDIEINSRPM